MAQDYRTLKLEVLAETKQFVQGMNSANKQTQTFGDKLGDFSKKAAAALAVVGAAAGAMAIKIGKEAVQAASDLAESTSKVGVIFGDVSKEITKFAAQAAASIGQTRTQAQNAASTFATFGKAAGLTGQDLSKFSIEFVELASDLASFNNTSVDQAITALGAALRGEAEPIRSYGVLLNDATLKAKAMEMGIYSGTGTLTAQQKVLAAHQVVLSQTTDAQGDFARTADGMANSQKILTARLEEAKITLGEALLPIALNVVNLFNDKFLPIIEKIAGSFSNPNGDGLIDRVREFVAEARDFLAPIIEATTAAFDRVSQAITTNKGNFEAVLIALKSIYEFSITYLIPILKNQLVSAIEGIGIAFSVVLKVVTPIIGSIAKLVNGIVTVVNSAIKSITSLANTAIDAINAVLKAYNAIPILPDVGLIPKISQSDSSGSNTTSTQLPFGGANLTGSVSSSSVNGVTSSSGTGGGSSSGKSLSFSIPSLASNFDVGSFRMAENKGNTINLTVNGAVDPIGTARQIAQILNTEASTAGSFTNLGVSRFATRAE